MSTPMCHLISFLNISSFCWSSESPSWSSSTHRGAHLGMSFWNVCACVSVSTSVCLGAIIVYISLGLVHYFFSTILYVHTSSSEQKHQLLREVLYSGIAKPCNLFWNTEQQKEKCIIGKGDWIKAELHFLPPLGFAECTSTSHFHLLFMLFEPLVLLQALLIRNFDNVHL